MDKRFFVLLTAPFAIALLVSACTQQKAHFPQHLQRQVTVGEKIFIEKECAKCHATNGEFANADTTAPDLASVFLAMDTLFVKAHLQFSELSAMAPIEMTPREMSSLIQYIGHLHAKANTDPKLQKPDEICPVCGALLKKSEAEANHLKITFREKDYFFECPDCKVVFQRDPVWHSQSGYLLLKYATEWSNYR